ncbi:hypothetical protein LTR85_001483 [Meristemomyces frigidus]|nr:hypothetical protein LTR85_001483 [Meristemomyces frigidus]
MAFPISLPSLSPREAVADAMYRCIIGLDMNDWPLTESAWVKDSEASFEMDGYAIVGIDALKAELVDRVGPLVTQHNISNVRVELKDGADTAYMTAYAVAYHFRPGEGVDPATKGLVSGATYHMDVVKEGGDGVWRIKKWGMKLLWLDGDRSITGR